LKKSEYRVFSPLFAAYFVDTAVLSRVISVTGFSTANLV